MPNLRGVLEDPTPLCTLPTASATHDGCSQTVGVWLKLEQRKSPRESGILANHHHHHDNDGNNDDDDNDND